MIDPETIDLYDDGFLSEVESRLVGAISSSCNCLTKTPDTKFHREDCRYRALAEGYAVIRAFRLREEERNLDAKGDALDRGL